MTITETIDNRIKKLTSLRQQSINNKDFITSNQLWARLEELKSLKVRFVDRDGNWTI
jgi:hypothetical protein